MERLRVIGAVFKLMNGQEIITTNIKHQLEGEAQIVEVLQLPVLLNSNWRRRIRIDDSGQYGS
ncbi:hypothetical protein BYT27DRAFT_7192206 [Phlegmacium glaucopus]|nr:hypothetical protein BYT27DRAFT_7192206 [Phlegmacium glaucopus]